MNGSVASFTLASAKAENKDLEEFHMTETSPIPTRMDEERQAFLRYLPKRIEAFEQRIQRYAKVGWDAPGMMLLRGDVQRLAETSGRYDLVAIRRHLVKLTQGVGEHITRRSVPDPQQTKRMCELLSAVVAESLALVTDSQPRPASSEPAAIEEKTEVVEPIQTPAPVETSETQETVESVETGETGERRIYHLSDGNAFATELGQRLKSAGYAIEAIDSVNALSDRVTAAQPHVLLVDASHTSAMAVIDTLRRDVQQRRRLERRVQMVVMAKDGIQTQRAANRAGVDLLLTPPFDIDDILDRLKALRSSAADEKARVLIVEDNPADAFYAQTILTNAGMQAEVEHDPMKVLESLKSLHPHLILMDLHMPVANGVEVTMLIREDPHYARLPILFLSGESNPVSRREALSAGGDDFLFKPIRPKDLIDAVQDRMRRQHSINKPAGAAAS
jgi:CheY-like chemotaxis protein